MMFISKTTNTLIDYETGDGFRTIILPSLITHDCMIISSKYMINQYFKEKEAITIHQVVKFIAHGNFEKIKLVFIDTLLPRSKSKEHQAMVKLCRNKQVVFIQSPRNKHSLSCAIELMSVTGDCKLTTIKYNKFMHLRELRSCKN